MLHAYNQRKLALALALDRVTNVLPRRRPSPLNQPYIPSRVLVIQSHLIGDLIMATPLLRALRKHYPSARISLLANSFAQELLDGWECVDDIFTMDFPWSTYNYSLNNICQLIKMATRLRRIGFDLAVDAQIDVRNAFLMYLVGAERRLGYDVTGGGVFLTDVPAFPTEKCNLLEARLALLEYLGIDCRDKKTALPLSEASLKCAETLLKVNKISAEKLVIIHPGASRKEKLWSAEGFAEVVRDIKEKGHFPLIVEGPGDRLIVDNIMSKYSERDGEGVARAKTSLRVLVALVRMSRLVVCLDSAALHIAGAVGTPAIVLYGPTWPELTKPPCGDIETIGPKSMERWVGENRRSGGVGTTSMDAISAEDVSCAIERMLGGKE